MGLLLYKPRKNESRIMKGGGFVPSALIGLAMWTLPYGVYVLVANHADVTEAIKRAAMDVVKQVKKPERSPSSMRDQIRKLELN